MLFRSNYIQVMQGLELLDLDAIREYNKKYIAPSVEQMSLQKYQQYVDGVNSSTFIEHATLLQQNKNVVNFN